MSTGYLTIDLHAIGENWRALDRLSAATVETGATVKARAYGLGTARVAEALLAAGARTFFVAVAEEGAALRKALGDAGRIFVFSGHMPGDTEAIRQLDLIPLLNSIEQITDHIEKLPSHPFGLQLDSGMNRLGVEPSEWAACRDLVMKMQPQLVMSHLACADEPGHPMNAQQLAAFREMTADLDAPLSLAATGGVLLGADYHFDMTRPGIGLYGGLPFADGAAVAYLSVPVIQSRVVGPGESVGYGNTWTARAPTRVATISMGYADGFHRAGSNRPLRVYAQNTPCPVIGRVSMDLVTVDISHLDHVPDELDILNLDQTIDVLAESFGTIGYEVLTSLGARYTRFYESHP